MDWSTVVGALLVGGFTLAGVWLTQRAQAKRDLSLQGSQGERDREARKWDREQRTEAEKARAYAEFIASLRMTPVLYADSYDQGNQADSHGPMGEFHVRRAWVELLASPVVRTALDEVGEGFDEFSSALEELVARVKDGNPPSSVWIIERWNNIMIDRVNRLAEAMRHDVDAT